MKAMGNYFAMLVFGAGFLLSFEPLCSEISTGGQIEFLEKQIESEPHRIDLLFRLSVLYEQNSDLEKALEISRDILKIDDMYDIRMRLGYLSLKLKDYEQASRQYRRAAEFVAMSEDAWVGTQSAFLLSGRFKEAIEAGKRALRLNKTNYVALMQQAFCRYMLEDYNHALKLYRKAEKINPEDGEHALGLGFTYMKLGDIEKGTSFCKRAKDHLRSDPRIDECLSMGKKSTIKFHENLYGTYLHYTNPWNQRNLINISASSAFTLPVGFGFWIGGTFTRTELRYEKENFWQAAPVAGIYFVRGGFAVSGSFSWIFSNDDNVDSTKVALLSGRYDGKTIGGGLDVSGSFYPLGNAFQFDPRIRFHMGNELVLSAGPELIIVAFKDETDESGGTMSRGTNNQMPYKMNYHWSGHVNLNWTPHAVVTILLRAYGGYRQFAVDDEGLSVWTSDDIFVGGYLLGITLHLAKHMGLSVIFRHDIGKEQVNMKHDFSVLGGSLGIHANF